LQKILAHAGVGSRRACEDLILQGRVTVGGQVVKELGTKVDLARISVAVDGQKVQQEKLVYFAVNKPKGFVSTNNDPSGRPRVLDILPQIAQRVYTVGRLDEMSVGLMLMTNDGELANKLAHPKFGVEKLYRVIVAGTPEREVLNQLTEGIWLAEGKVRAKRVRAVAKKGDATILELVLAEGKNREVRRMLAKLGHKVMMLTRVAVGPITLKGLGTGEYRPLTGREVDLLRRVAAGEAVPMPWAADRRPRPEGDRRPPNREGRDQPRSFGSAPPRPGGGPPPGSRGPARPHGPGYRPEPMADDRRSGPSMGMRHGPGGPPQRGPGGPPRRPGMFQAAPDDSVVRRSGNDRPSGPGGGPPRRDSNGPRPYQNGPPQGRFNGPRPYNDGPPQNPRGSEPRPGRPSGGPQGRPPYSASDNSGPRPPRFGPRPGEDRPPQGGGDRRDNRSNGPRRFDGDDRRNNQSNGPRRFAGNDRPNNQSGPGGGNGGGDRRPQSSRRKPLPGSTEPTRKVIGLDASVGSPGPTEDRPKPRLKRPAPRGAAPSSPRPMPKRRPTRRGDD